MALTLLYADDFSGYTSQAAFEAAYPYDPPTDTSSSVVRYDATTPYVAWGLTRGPGGVPGIENVTATEAPDPFGHGQFAVEVDKVNLAPQCRFFRVVGTWDFGGFTPTESQNQSSHLFTVWSYESGNRSGSFDGNLVFVGRNHITGAIIFNVHTTLAFGNAGAFYSQNINSVLLESGGQYTILIDGKRSELTESSPGVWAPSTDGFVHVSVNGTQLFSFDGPVWHGDSSTNRTWNSVTAVSVGQFTDWQIYDSNECITAPPPCECEPPPKVPPTLPPVIPKNPPKTPPIIGLQLACIGGGLVPTQADLVYIENWWGL